jgi:hypothetical protein
MYKIYYIDENGIRQSPGDNELTSTNLSEAKQEFRSCAKSLSELEGWESRDFVMADNSGRRIDSVSFADDQE